MLEIIAIGIQSPLCGQTLPSESYGWPRVGYTLTCALKSQISLFASYVLAFLYKRRLNWYIHMMWCVFSFKSDKIDVVYISLQTTLFCVFQDWWIYTSGIYILCWILPTPWPRSETGLSAYILGPWWYLCIWPRMAHHSEKW